MGGIKVDRYLKQLPERFFDERGRLTEEGEEWYEYDNRWKQAVWSKLGGTDDFVTDVQNGELYEPGIQTSNADELIEELEVSAEMQIVLDLSERVEELENADNSALIAGGLEVITIATGDTAFTTTGNQLIICNNTAALTITLNLAPDDGEMITVIRRDASISLVGDVNGSTPTAIPSKNDVLDVYYTLAAGEWSA